MTTNMSPIDQNFSLSICVEPKEYLEHEVPNLPEGYQNLRAFPEATVTQFLVVPTSRFYETTGTIPIPAEATVLEAMNLVYQFYQRELSREEIEETPDEVHRYKQKALKKLDQNKGPVYQIDLMGDLTWFESVDRSGANEWDAGFGS
jgi:hypothetical protein